MKDAHTRDTVVLFLYACVSFYVVLSPGLYRNGRFDLL